eukprot:gnl/TRDRNA2_/TRDRNA2_35218_c0_seq1.p1 gnl/TRDRNA2_/TRDRNA2_35218_c0~~gnl/TRDRNA2_/TRDRNA2_35218_c0_seq1.p1  ORF type:complete len:204 (-),score=22.75 gnl/TRDRNA2_/TRDRNA2_35218_c0_seq1:76-630(-)
MEALVTKGVPQTAFYPEVPAEGQKATILENPKDIYFKCEEGTWHIGDPKSESSNTKVYIPKSAGGDHTNPDKTAIKDHAFADYQGGHKHVMLQVGYNHFHPKDACGDGPSVATGNGYYWITEDVIGRGSTEKVQVVDIKTFFPDAMPLAAAPTPAANKGLLASLLTVITLPFRIPFFMFKSRSA